jgi:predicted transcriptional regulator
MSKQISATISDGCATALKRLAAQEHRSESNCIAAILERAFPELRQEWSETGTLQTLRKKKHGHRRDHSDIENMPA